MLNDIKVSMRITHDKLNSDIQRNIDACMLDLKRVGVCVDKPSGLLTKAAELYCKAEYDYLGKGERYKKNYEDLRNAMSMSGEYKDVE